MQDMGHGVLESGRRGAAVCEKHGVPGYPENMADVGV